MDERHGVLQLVAESVGAAGLVIATAPPQSAGQGLIDQPAVGQHVHRGSGVSTFTAPKVWFQCSHTVSSACRAPARPPNRWMKCRASSHHGRAEDEHDLARLPGGQIDPGLDRGARIQAGPVRPDRRLRRIAAGLASEQLRPMTRCGFRSPTARAH